MNCWRNWDHHMVFIQFLFLFLLCWLIKAWSIFKAIKKLRLSTTICLCEHFCCFLSSLSLSSSLFLKIFLLLLFLSFSIYQHLNALKFYLWLKPSTISSIFFLHCVFVCDIFIKRVSFFSHNHLYFSSNEFCWISLIAWVLCSLGLLCSLQLVTWAIKEVFFWPRIVISLWNFVSLSFDCWHHQYWIIQNIFSPMMIMMKRTSSMFLFHGLYVKLFVASEFGKTTFFDLIQFEYRKTRQRKEEEATCTHEIAFNWCRAKSKNWTPTKSNRHTFANQILRRCRHWTDY